MNQEDLAQQIFARIGCFNIAEWLHELAQAMTIDSAQLMPVPVLESHTVNVAQKGLKLTLSHPHAGNVEDGDCARWALGADRCGIQFDRERPRPLGGCIAVRPRPVCQHTAKRPSSVERWQALQVEKEK
jgi:hypothetical protein